MAACWLKAHRRSHGVSGPARQMPAGKHPVFAGFGEGAHVVALPSGHWPMFSRPEDTVPVLAQIAVE